MDTARPDRTNEAEQHTLGALMLQGQAYYKIVGFLDADDFSSKEHREIYKAVGRLLKNNTPVDALTMAEELDGEVSADYVGMLLANTPTAANIVAYARIVKENSRLFNTGQTLQSAIDCLNAKNIDETVSECMIELQKLSGSGRDDMGFGTVIEEAQEVADEALRRRHSGEILGISTNMPKLDRLTGGLHGAKLIVLGGRPGTYKSAFAWQTLVKAAKRGKSCGMVSLEMQAYELGQRAISNIHRINGHDIASGDSQAIMEVNRKVGTEMKKWPLRIDDKSYTLNQIVARLVEWKYKYNIQAACVDYLQLVRDPGAKSRFEELGNISRQFKLLANRLGIPIIVLSQLSRDVEKENRRPRLSDLRESGNLEQDADIVIFTHRIMGDEQSEDEYEIILAKQRGGAARKIIDVKTMGEHYFIGEQV